MQFYHGLRRRAKNSKLHKWPAVEDSNPWPADGGMKGQLLPLNRWNYLLVPPVATNYMGCDFSNEQNSSGLPSVVYKYVQTLSRNKQGTWLPWKWWVWSKKFFLSLYILCNIWSSNHGIHLCRFIYRMGFLGGSVVKNPPANAGNASLIPGLGRSPGEGNGNPFQYSCLENPMDREAWRVTVHGVTKSWTRLNN